MWVVASEKSPSRVKPLKLGDFFLHRLAYHKQGWGSQKSQQCRLESKNEVNWRRQGPLHRAQIYRTTEEKTSFLCSEGLSSKGGDTGKLKVHGRDLKTKKERKKKKKWLNGWESGACRVCGKE